VRLQLHQIHIAYLLIFPAYYDPLEQVEMVGRFDHNEPGFRADPKMPNLLATATKVEDLSPYSGTELHGVQLVSFYHTCSIA
jgi:hypothetical protein